MYLIWATLLFTVKSNIANTVASEGAVTSTAEAGLCVVIPCNFTSDPNFNLSSAFWYKCEQNCDDSNTNTNLNTLFNGRVSPLEPDLIQKNCGSIIINDLTVSDSGSYKLLNGRNETYNYTVTITVRALTQKPTVMVPPLIEGQQTTLTCTAPGLCSGSRPKITWMWRGTGENDSHITGNITEFKTENLTAVTQRHSSTLTFNPSAEHHGTSVTCKVSFTNNITTEETVTLNVTYVKKPQITGNRTIKEGDTLHLTCKTFPLSLVMWTQVPSNKNLHNKTGIGPQNNTETATIVIHNVTAEHTGQYVCTAVHFNMTVYANVIVTLHPKILNSSRCKNKLEVLTCVCISQGSPLPIIEWPLLENHPEYFVSTSVSNLTVNSTVILTVKNQNNTVECVSRNKNGEVKGNLIVDKDKQEEEGHAGHIMKLLGVVTRLEIIITFFIGALISAVICCLVTKCHRKKQRTYGNVTETLEMVTSHEEPLIDAGQAVEDEQAIDQEAAEAGGAVAAGKSDVEYSNLDFSLIKRPNPAEAGTTQGTPETEYAEIKKEKEKEREDGEGREEEEMIGEDEETKYCVPDEEEGEDGALYSTVKDVMGEDSVA